MTCFGSLLATCCNFQPFVRFHTILADFGYFLNKWVGPLAMPQLWRTGQNKHKRKRFRDRRPTFTTVYVVGW
jgi:hypothetical protein